MTEPRIFISYARSDGEPFATELRTRLAAEVGEEQLWQDRARMEGGVGWWGQIAEALEKVDFMVLVATPNAMDSPIVKKEWLYARQQGVCVYPVQVPGLPVDFAKFPRWMRDSHFYNLDKEWETFVNYLKNPCHAVKVPFMAPDLPTHFVERPAKFNELVTKLLDSDRQNPVAITTALRGAGGFGKTTLAAALCHDDDVQTAFDDGVLWVTLGENPDTLGGLTKLYAALTGERPSFVDTEDAANHLAEKLAELDCLIVIDDVWNPAHLRPFLRGGERCARLITTRMMDVAVGANAETTEVDEMTADESVAMLVGGIGKPSSQTLLPQGEGLKEGDSAHSSEGSKSASSSGVAVLGAELKAAFRKLAGRLGEWPLMLELANGALRKRIARGDTVERAIDYLHDLLTDEGAGAFDPRNPQERNQAIGASVGASLRLLEGDERERLCELAIFKDDIDIPITTIQRLWAMKGRQAERLCESFADLSLVKFDVENSAVRLHDVIREYLGGQLADAKAVHGRLIDAWGDAYTLPDEFVWRWYGYHLIGAGQNDRLRELLLDFRWLQAKLDATDTNSLIADCETLIADPTIRLVKSALNMSAHILVEDKTALAQQLVGRLMTHRGSNAEIHALTETLMTIPGIYPAYPDGEYPILSQAGGALLRTLSGHTGGVNGAMQLTDGRLLSWAGGGLRSRDHTLRLWDADGVAMAVMAGHTGMVIGVVQLADGSLLSWAGGYESKDHTVRLWDAGGAVLAVLAGHTRGVSGAMQLADGRLLSWSGDHTLRLWDAGGAELAVMAGHTGMVSGAMQLADGRLLSWAGGDLISKDHTLRLWEADGAELAVMAGHTSGVSGAMQLADGRLLSWSHETTLRLWDADGAALAVMAGHTHMVIGAMQLVDGRLLSWAGDHTLRLWDADGAALAVLAGHTDGVIGAMQLADGRLLSWSGDRTLRLWDADGVTLAVMAGHTGMVSGAMQLADGRLLSWSGDRTLRLWEADGAALAVLAGHTDEVKGAMQLADGRLLSWSWDRTVRLWEADGAALAVLAGHTDGVKGVIQLSDGRLLSWAGGIGSKDHMLRLWEADGAALAVMAGHTGAVSGAMQLSDSRLLSWSSDHTLRLWEADGAELVVMAGHTSGVNGVMQLADSRLLSWAYDRTLRLWEADGTPIDTLNEPLWGNHERIYAWARGHDFYPDMLYAERDPALDNTYCIKYDDITYGYINYRIKIYRWSDDVTVATFQADAEITCVTTIPEKRLIVAGDEVGRVMFLRLVE